MKLHVLGQRFEQVPDAFVAARSEFADAIATWGFVEPDLYRRCLASADVFVSTAQHEFFGIAAAEAMAAGVHPLLPDRLAYPELVGADAEALYPSDDGATEAASLAERLAALYERHGSHDWPSRTRWSGLVDRYRWSQRIPVLDAALNSVVAHPG